MLPIAGKVVLLFMIGITFYAFGRRMNFLIKLLQLGKSEERFDQFRGRLKYALGQVLTQRCTLKNVSRGDYAGIGHLLLVYGFSLFLLSYLFHIAEAFYEKLSPALLGGVFNNLFFLFLDVTGLIVVGAIIWAAVRRYMIRPDRLEPTVEAGIILFAVFCLVMLHYTVSGFRFLMEAKTSAGWAFVGMAFSRCFENLGLKSRGAFLFWAFWWLHLMVVFGFGVYLLYSKHLHILASHFNLLFHSTRPKGSLGPIEDLEERGSSGVSKLTEFSWKQLLDLYACTQCGRCTESCPASRSGKPLRPGDIIHNLKLHLLTSGKGLLEEETGRGNIAGARPAMVGEVVTEEELWACTTCHACMEVCPSDIEHVERIVQLRRNLVTLKPTFPSEYKQIFKNLETFGDPMAKGPLMREEWAQDLKIRRLYQDANVDFLFYVGCVGALYDETTRNKTVAAATLLEKAGVDFGILGKEERCCGDAARRMGNELLFKKFVDETVGLIRKYKIRKIVTYCPHCFHVFRNEYSLLGVDLKVIHFTELIRDLLREGKLRVKTKADGLFTYHDPCYLGRCNSIYQIPREILDSVLVSGIKEMVNFKDKGFCCGAGGGNFWKGTSTGRRIEELRVEEAIATKTDGIITACPFCEIMFDSTVRQKGLEGSFKVMDVIELVSQIT